MGNRITGMFSGLDPKLVEKLIEVEKMPVENAKKRRESTINERKEIEKLQGMLADLDAASNNLKTESDFYRFKVDSSHPDIIEGIVDGFTVLGTYEFEVRGLAKNEKELAYGFPDKNDTPVGFGFMLIEREDQEPAEVVIEPDSTLEEVAQQINDSGVGVRAMVVNTKYEPDGYRLLVVSDKSGKEAKIYIDEDTTFLEFKEQVTGRNLDVLFEDVPITDNDNVLDELLSGVTFNIKRSEPGTRIQVNIVHDVEGTIEGIREFVGKYNSIVQFMNSQSSNPSEEKPGLLSGDGSVKSLMRQLQYAFFPGANTETKFRTLAEIGIVTNPKTGELQMDDAKVQSALTEDYDSVAQLFIRSRFGDGIGQRVANKIKAFRDPTSGIIKSRLRGLDSIIKNQDQEIERRERNLGDKEASIRRRFSALESQMQALKGQGDFLAARFGGGGGPSPGGGQS
jgi:flagellar hook-associated protein 2